MKTLVCLAVLLHTVPPVLAEEISSISQAELTERVYSDAIGIPALVRGARSAGVGVFLNTPTPESPTVDIQVQQWWTPPLETDIVTVHDLDRTPTNWGFPTDVPVVFFTITKRQTYRNHPAFTMPDSYPPEWVHSITNEVEMAKHVFPSVDRSWFRVERDNGLLYTFATNLWDCVRANPDPARYYEVLRDADRTVSRTQSWRVKIDASKGLSWLFGDASEAFLADKLNDPMLSDGMRNSVGNRLKRRFGWTYSYLNGVENWHPPE